MNTSNRKKKLTFEDVENKIDHSCLTSESKSIFKLFSELFKTVIYERDTKITSLEQKVEENRNKMEFRLAAVEEELGKVKTDLSAALSSNSKLRSQLQVSQNAHDELEAYGRRESLVFSGNVVKASRPNEDCCLIARDIIKDVLKIQKDPIISTAHRIGKPPANSSSPDKRGIIVKFVQRDDKFLIMKAAKQRKAPGLYINESLTATRAKIHNVLRQCRKMKDGLVTGTSTLNGRVFAYTKPAPNAPSGTPSIRTEINTEEQLRNFCINFIKKPLDSFLDSQGKKFF